MNKKNAIILAISILLLGLLVSGGTYAYWSWTSNTNKTVVFNTAKELIEYVEYDAGESNFVGAFEVSTAYNQGIHSTISIKKKDDPDVANVDLVATIKMDINDIGTNMKQSTALKWVVTSGTSSNIIEVLASGNFVGTNAGDVLTLYPNIPVTTTKKDFTVWIWLDASENPSELLTGETLDTVVWTQIDQVEGAQDSFEITRINANYQVISATAVNSKYKITDYAVTTINTQPSSWTGNIASANQSNVYTLKHTVSRIGTYYVWFLDEQNNVVSKPVSVTTVDDTAPTCTFGSWDKSSVANDKTARINLTCVDEQSGFMSSNLQISDFSVIVSNANASLTHINKTSVTNGYQYTLTLTGVSGNGRASIKLLSNKVKNSMNLGNSEVTSSTISVINSYTISYELDGGSHSTSCGISTIPQVTTYGVDVVICNPNKEGYTFAGWTSSSNDGLGSDAKTGTTANPSTAWTGTSTTNTYFKNLRTTSGTVTLTATWLKSSYQNVDSNSYYLTLAAAMSAVKSNQTIRALDSNGVETTSSTLASGKTGVKLDLNGQIVSIGGNHIYIDGELDIYSSLDGATLEGSSNDATTSGVIVNRGILTTGLTNDKTLTIQNTGTSANCRVIYNNSGKTATLGNGTTIAFTEPTSSSRYLIGNPGTLNIEGATLLHTLGTGTYQRGINNTGVVVMTSGSITTRGNSIYNSSSNENAVNIQGGDIRSTNHYAIWNSAAAKVAKVSGGTIKGTIGIYKGNITINGDATIEGTSTYGVEVDDGSLTMSAGTVTGKTTGLYVTSGTVEMSGGTINGTTIGAYVTTGNIKITNGLITGKTHGVQVNGAGTLQMGEDDGNVIDGFPEIKSDATGSYYGVSISSTGTFKFYDGFITSTKGQGHSINSSASEVPNGYGVVKTLDDGTETASLSKIAYMYYLNVDTQTYYISLSDALSAVANDQTIQLLADKTETVSATNTKNGVKLDLNGCTITMGTNSIINNGTLDIYSSSSSGGIIQGSNEVRTEGVITNNGTLTTNATGSTNAIMLQSTSEQVTSSVIANSAGATVTLNTNTNLTFINVFHEFNSGVYRYLVWNNGILNISGANLVNNVNDRIHDCGVVNFNSASRVVMTSGTISAVGFGINNWSGKGTNSPAVSIDGGMITSSKYAAVSSNATGSVIVTGGTISGYSAGIDANSGVVRLGSSGGNPSIVSPLVQAENGYGIRVDGGTIDFYDGKVVSNKGIGRTLNVAASNVETGYFVNKFTIDGVETAILLETGHKYYNASSNAFYETLSSAFTAAADDDTIQVLTNVTETANATNTKSDVKLDLKNYTITMDTNYIINSGSLDIYSSISNGGTIQGSNTDDRTNGVIKNDGVLTTNNIYNIYPVTIKNVGTLVTGVVIANSVGATVTLNSNTSIIIPNALTTVPSDASYRYLIWNLGILNVAGASLTNTANNTIYDGGICTANAAGRIVMSSGTILTSGYSINNYSGTSTSPPAVEITGGSVTSNTSYALWNQKTGTVEINDSIITGKTGIENKSSGVITLGSIDNAVNSNSPQIIGTGTGSSKYGIKTSGTVKFYDGFVSSAGDTGNSIKIVGSGVVETPQGYIVTKITTDGIEKATLISSDTPYYNVNTSSGYATLNAAFASAANGNTIKVLSNKTETADATNSKSNIKLDLNGYTITMGTYSIINSGSLDIYSSSSSGGTIQGSNTSSTAGVIKNNGTLTTNATESANTINLKNTGNVYGCRVIYNGSGKTLTLNLNTNITFTTAIADANNKYNRYLISTDGIVNVLGATLTNAVDNTIYNSGIDINTATARVVMSSGTINVTGYGILNRSGTGTTTPAISVSGGTIISDLNNSILSYGGKTLLTGGTFKGGTDAQGIYYIGSGTILELGVNGGIPSTTSPLIEGRSSTKYGVYGDSGTTLNFYDGKITSDASDGHAININPSTVQSGYAVYKSTSNGVETAVLGRQRAIVFNSNGTGLTLTDQNGNTSTTSLTINVVENPLTGSSFIHTPSISGKPNFFSSNSNETGSYKNPSSGATVLWQNSIGYLSSNSPTTFYVAARPITITFNRNGVNQIGGGTANITKTCYYASGSSDKSCDMVSPSITPGSGYVTVGWNTSSSATTSAWKPENSLSVNTSTATTWYAIRKASGGGTGNYSVTLSPNNGRWRDNGTAVQRNFSYSGTTRITSFPGISRNYYALKGWLSYRTGLIYTYSIDSSDNGDTLIASWYHTGSSGSNCLCFSNSDCSAWGTGATCVLGMCQIHDAAMCY